MTTSIDAYFGEVRELLNQPPSDHAWDELCQWLTLAWEEDAGQVRAHWLSYLEGALARWPESIKQAPESWRTFSRQPLHALASEDISPYGDLAKQPDTLTENGALSYSTSGSKLLDYFAKAGTYRERYYVDVARDMKKCWEESPELTVRMIFYLRAVVRKARGFYHSDEVVYGQGARDESRKAMRWLLATHPAHFYDNMWLIPLVGVWKDLWHVTLLEAIDHERVYDLIEIGMKDPYNRDLLAKYLPKHRSKSNTRTRRHRELNAFASGLRKRLGWKQRDYRRFKASGESHDFQRKMCEQKFWEVDFNRIPGRAMSQIAYSRGKDGLTTLERHGAVWLYDQWLAKNPDKVKFTGYVHELVPIANGYNSQSWQLGTADEQFNRLLELARDEDGKGLAGDVLCALDTSGSMMTRVHNTTAFDICVGLGVYFSALNEGVFKDRVVMFDTTSRTLALSGSFCERVRAITRKTSAMGGTNFQSVIDELVRQRRRRMDEPASAFPSTLLVVSDMQFNPANGRNTRTNYEEAMQKLASVGLGRMRIIWWFVTGRGGDMPARLDDEGVILIGGFSGAILKLLLDGEAEVFDDASGGKRRLKPIEQMVRALDQEVLRLVRA